VSALAVAFGLRIGIMTMIVFGPKVVRPLIMRNIVGVFVGASILTSDTACLKASRYDNLVIGCRLGDLAV
jgi:hypothetical protein